MLGIKLLVCPHHCHQIIRVAEVDNVVCIAGHHMNCLDMLIGYLEFQHFIRSDLSFLNQAVTADNYEEFPFDVVPVLPPSSHRVWRC